MNLKYILGKNIKYYRYKNNYSQEYLAELLRVSTNYIGRIERGQHNPTLEKIEKIANTLKVEPYKLFVWHDKLNDLPQKFNSTTTTYNR